MHRKPYYTLSGIKLAFNGTFCRKEAYFSLIFQIAFKRCVIAASKRYEDHFCAEAETDEE